MHSGVSYAQPIELTRFFEGIPEVQPERLALQRRRAAKTGCAAFEPCGRGIEAKSSRTQALDWTSGPQDARLRARSQLDVVQIHVIGLEQNPQHVISRAEVDARRVVLEGVPVATVRNDE
jgi:hypothetical protein